MAKAPTDIPTDAPPGKFSNRRMRRRLLKSTNGADRRFYDLALRFLLTIKDPRAKQWTYREIFQGYNAEWINYTHQVNPKRRKAGEPEIDGSLFADTFAPREYEERARKVPLNELIRSIAMPRPTGYETTKAQTKQSPGSLPENENPDGPGREIQPMH